MNMLAQIQNDNNTDQVTMSSPDLVDYINAHRKEVATIEKPYKELRHDHFMAKVPQVLGEKAAPIFLGTDIYTNGTGGTVQRQIYRFPKREACLMAMSYSYELQAQIFDRMTAMEEALKKPAITLPDFTDPAEAAMAWAEQYKAKQLAEKQVAVLAPKAQALDTIANTSQTYCLRECAKTIGIKESDLIDLLLLKKWIYREPSSNPKKKGKLQPYAQYVTCGVFINRASPVMADSFGVERVHLNMQVTAFGLTRITGLVNKNKGDAAA